eukprot:TRINITY_DN6246_c0_g1_i1.p1 TRINITY_DN6246_c0_g1~~TRINITY_DN6246_c0_g1_i1.p1  ORF type:complete len:218 (+),score=59.44 TRINITY_DN6246_c0_g1_i1:51-704(+)
MDYLEVTPQSNHRNHDDDDNDDELSIEKETDDNYNNDDYEQGSEGETENFDIGGIPKYQFKWSPSHCGSNGNISADGLVFTKLSGGTDWNCGCLAASSTSSSSDSWIKTSFRIKFKLENLSTDSNVMIGVSSPTTFKPNSNNYNLSGYYLHCHNGSLFSQSKDASSVWNKEGGMILYLIDGVCKGVAFSQPELKNVDQFCPAIDVSDPNTSIRIVNE